MADEKLDEQVSNSVRAIPEIGAYFLTTGLLIVCVFLGNILINFAWGIKSSYSFFGGPFIAAIQTAGTIFLYMIATSFFERLKPRHLAVPPLMLSVVGLTVIAVAGYVKWPHLYNNTAEIYEQVSALVTLLGWCGYGFYSLFSAARRQEREYGRPF